MSASSAGFEVRPLAWLLGGVNLPLAVGAVALAVYAASAGPYDLRLPTIAGIYGLLVMGFQFVFGYAGAVSLAQSCFFGLGAYVTGVLGVQFDLGTAATFPLSIAAAGLLAVVIAAPVMRLDDHYFALATLTVSLLVELIATQWTAVTGGTNGLSGIPSIRLLGQTISSRFDVMLVVWGIVSVGALLAAQLTRGLYGRAFHLMRESASVASALGLDVARMRLAAFVGSALYGGAAGALMAHVIHVISPEQLGLPLMISCLTMTVLGGRLSIPGAIIGALLVTYLREYFRALENYTLIAYGSVTLGFLILAPEGLVGSVARLRQRWLPMRGAVTFPAPNPVRPAAVPSALLSVMGVSKAFGGVQALNGVSLALVAGEIVGLIGPNGSGKTTLLNTISGLYSADSGSLAFAGHDITRLAPFRIARLGMARTFQHIHLVDDMTVLDNIALGRAGPTGVGAGRSLLAVGHDDGLGEARAVAMNAAGMLGVADQAGAMCGTLAYGTRRRVEVARALAAGPKLLLLDEPAAGFNEQEQRDLARRVRKIAETGVTVLVVEHNLVFLAALAERLVCLDRGVVIADGLAEDVRQHPAVIEAYLGDGP